MRIPAVNGVYSFHSESTGTYHELVAGFVGSFSGKVAVRVRRYQNAAWDAVTVQPVDISTVTAGIMLGFIHEVELTITEAIGTGYAEVELISKETGIADNLMKGRGWIQSIARVYPQGISLVTAGRPRLNYQSIQNRDNQAIYFWHGYMPTDIAQVAYLPVNPATWTTEQKAAAELFITTYGEKIDAGATYEPHMAQTGPLYSYVAASSAVAHVKVG